MSKTKILYIQHFSGMGGAILSLFYIIEKLDREQFEPYVLFLGGEGPGVDFFRKKNIPVYVRDDISWYAHSEGARYKFFSRRPLRFITDWIRVLPSVRKLVRFLDDKDFAIVHLNTSLLIPAAIAAKKTGSKVVWHIRESLYHGWFGIRKAWARKMILKYSDHIIAISYKEADRIGSNNKTSVIYNYVDFNRFNKERKKGKIRKEFNVKESEFLVCNLGGVVHSKGADVYLKAAAILREKSIPIRMLLVGYAPDNNIELNLKERLIFFLKRWLRNEYNLSAYTLKLFDSLDLNDTLVFTGLRNDVPSILADSDVLVWTATLPHFARPIIEAGAMELPAIATDYPHTREVVGDEASALLVPANDPAALANAIKRLYDNPVLSEKLAKEGYRRAKKNFNADINADRVFAIYSDLLEVYE